jgi:hypothetical protein
VRILFDPEPVIYSFHKNWGMKAEAYQGACHSSSTCYLDTVTTVPPPSRWDTNCYGMLGYACNDAGRETSHEYNHNVVCRAVRYGDQSLAEPPLRCSNKRSLTPTGQATVKKRTTWLCFHTPNTNNTIHKF